MMQEMALGQQPLDFISSIDLRNHPLLSSKRKIIIEYINTLFYFVNHSDLDDYSRLRLMKYSDTFDVPLDSLENLQKKYANKIFYNKISPWKSKYKYWMLCDLAMILMDKTRVSQIADMISSPLTKRQRERIRALLMLLNNNSSETCIHQEMIPIINQYKQNHIYSELTEKRIVVTANMSAGKSTFINAIIGKPLARTSEEACTGNLCEFFSKPFEDGNIHLFGDKITFQASESDLTSFSWDTPTNIASYFRFTQEAKNRFRLIDTPGVNSAINKNHGQITKSILMTMQYDLVVYILNASKLGTDEELRFIRWISDHIPHEKVIFVINKLDNFKNNEDDILDSINGVRSDLLRYFEKPVICPLSARFALLLKLKSFHDCLSEDENDEYEYLVKKFSKPAFDLSKYYYCPNLNDESNQALLLQKCGIWGLERLLLNINKGEKL